MNIGVIVFARMQSSRLPGKALMALGDRPLVGRVLDRARRVRGACGVILATSTDGSDDPLADFARSEGIAVHRGSLDNVALRAFECAREQGWTSFARVCGDRPFFNPGDTARAIACLAEGYAGKAIDLVSSRLSGPVPPGLTTEVVRTAALEKALDMSADPQDLEHVTRYLYAHPEVFRLVGIPVTGMGESLRLVVDTDEDLQRARFIIGHLPNPAEASFAEVADLARAWDQEAMERCDV
jgi:spore coat polysaccharide biosynthesis protein SpsF